MSDGLPTGGEPPGPAVQGYNVPGRKPGSQMPWEFFMGNASHRLTAYMYGVNHQGRWARARVPSSRQRREVDRSFLSR
jgi:hypothetical protein